MDELFNEMSSLKPKYKNNTFRIKNIEMKKGYFYPYYTYDYPILGENGL